ncbi:cobalt/nickel transport system permease protein [Halanaerobium saccharolyticum]|uniref:Cobalt/nickel transport system permease protein n=1 Tax=Halanaerobium saccharolyticum TaxID=43595 RepID=A0A4R7Z9Q2_9FIRM|nr:cobalt transporter CbiM [Halanaerobium saccharolyticum]RAK10584.1 cobalt/nickel transport system permease protein [Halanaerobium saccharolyticum]TDW06659.1 cobalt/nickel transport system permease protein [Halanaerobium saccharolyticum]TDX62294.1 cobalt/nickel transport system permease protein [Halanaerobium saccharolyticum]
MHISEGVLSAPVLFGGGLFSAVGVAVGLKKMKDQDIPKTAIVSAALFVASLIHVPIGPTSIHLLLNGIAGIMLGWQVFPAVLIALFLQSILFQFGGITALGVNTLNVALPAIIAHQFFKIYDLNNSRVFLGTVAFFSGALAVFLTAVMVAVSLFFTNQSFLEIAKLTIISHVPVIIIEGIISVFVVFAIEKIKPIILEELDKK